MPAEFTSFDGENGLDGSGSLGGTFAGCVPHVSQEPSSSERRSRLSLKSAVSLAFNPGTGCGMVDSGFALGPGSFALKRCPKTAGAAARSRPVAKTLSTKYRERCVVMMHLSPIDSKFEARAARMLGELCCPMLRRFVS